MRVLLAKRTEEGSHILFVPRRGTGRPPKMLKGVKRENLKAVVAATIRDIKGEQALADV